MRSSNSLRPSNNIILRQGSRTFYFASRLLPTETRHDVEVLYAFCRTLDDIVDEPKTHESALSRFCELRAETLRPNCAHADVGEFCRLVRKYDISKSTIERFFRGQESDLCHEPIQTLDTLIEYCNCVASSVGSMLLPILGVKDSRAVRHAEALGTAMQLTNISRDIVEDFRRGRVYVPACILEAEQIRLAIQDRDPKASIALNAARCNLLKIADSYYELAETGMIYLPFSVRLSIRSAAGAYRAIGDSIKGLPGDDIDTRARTTYKTKLKCVVRAIAKSLRELLSSKEVSGS